MKQVDDQNLISNNVTGYQTSPLRSLPNYVQLSYPQLWIIHYISFTFQLPSILGTKLHNISTFND